MSSGVINTKAFNKHVQVFETKKWAELVSAVTQLAENNLSLVVSMTLLVIPNQAQGVQGGYEADVVFVFNCMPDNWLSNLPDDSNAKLKDLKELQRFPAIATTKLDYDSDLAIYLSQLASYNMKSALPAIISMLSKN